MTGNTPIIGARSGALENLLAAARAAGNGAAGSAPGPAPVDQWNPPYCGDIGLEIRRDGTWWYRGSPIGRIAMVKMFARVLRKDDDGRTYLVTPVEKVDVAVADAPFLAVEMAVEGEGSGQSLTFRTNLDDVVAVSDAHPLRFAVEEHSGGLKPYVHIRGRLEALVTRAVYADLVACAAPDPEHHTAESDGDNAFDAIAGIWSGGTFWRFPEIA